MVMSVAELGSKLRKSTLRLLSQLVCLAGIAACSLLALSLFNAIDDRGYGAILVETFRASGRALGSLARMDAVYASFLFPFLIVATLSLAGMAMLSRRDD